MPVHLCHEFGWASSLITLCTLHCLPAIRFSLKASKPSMQMPHHSSIGQTQTEQIRMRMPHAQCQASNILSSSCKTLFKAQTTHLGQQLQAPGQHGIHTPHSGEVEPSGQLLLALPQPQQVPRRHIPLQQLLEQVVQGLHATGWSGNCHQSFYGTQDVLPTSGGTGGAQQLCMMPVCCSEQLTIAWRHVELCE